MIARGADPTGDVILNDGLDFQCVFNFAPPPNQAPPLGADGR
jgi:hypothetical protein